MIKLSIVTVFKFGQIEELERTAVSVRRQTLKPYQHIIVISGSEDVYEKVATLNNEFTQFIVNKDRSLYHAMNIGLKQATGDAVLFLNGGDEFFSNDAVEEINAQYQPGRCLAMRAAQYYDSDIYIRPSYNRIADLNIWPSHQSFLAPLPESQEIKFNEIKLISADSGWMKKLIAKHGLVTSQYILVKFSLGGISNMPSMSTVIARLKSDGIARGALEILKLLIRIILGNRSYYRILLTRKCDKHT